MYICICIYRIYIYLYVLFMYILRGVCGWLTVCLITPPRRAGCVTSFNDSLTRDVCHGALISHMWCASLASLVTCHLSLACL